MPGSTEANVIRLRGVRHNNLKGFDLDVPVGRLVVITGLSGSGKSSLAFDTLYAEGQRRYIETFSPYARQFFDRMDKPQVDSIEGIPPAIAIEQRNTVRSTRSTVGTMTEICDHMKVLWPHLAQLHCRQCGQPVCKESPQRVWKTLNAARGLRDAECLITFDLPLSEKLSPAESLDLIAKQGYQRLLLDGDPVRLEEAEPRFKRRRSHVTVIQDRVRLTPSRRARFVEACEQAYHFGKGRLSIRFLASATRSTQHAIDRRPAAPTAPASPGSPLHFSNRLHCATCDLDYTDPTPALFSFNHPVGACPACKGFGRIITIDYDIAIPDRSKTLAEGAIKPWQAGMSAECQRDMMKFCRATGVPTKVPFKELAEKHQRWIIDGDPEYGTDEEHEWPRAWYGIKGYFRWLESKSYKMHVRVLLSRYRAYTTCPDCRGARLKPDALLYQVSREADRTPHRPSPAKLTPFPAGESGRLSLAGFYALPVSGALDVIGDLTRRLHASNSTLEHALREVQSRLRYLNEIGLGYLTLDRTTRSLSGGETERVNLATCLGTRLVNTLFVLDEPSVGLHPRDTGRLVTILEALRNEGNTVVVVEHERSVMEAADQIIDLGPGHGASGGQLVFQGTHSQILRSGRSLTGKYLRHQAAIKTPERRPVDLPTLRTRSSKKTRRAAPAAIQESSSRAEPSSDGETQTASSSWLRVAHASRHNLKGITVDIPLNRFVCISGVSGSGKSTLIRDVLLPALQQELGTIADATKASDRMDDTDESSADSFTPTATRITGVGQLSHVVLVDQSSLGKTPRSNPAVYTGAFDHIRELFAQSEDARRQGLNASAFSFNSAQGQCERCRGAGFEKVEMQFLSDVFIRCPDCNGRRYREHILEVKIQHPESGSGDGRFSIADLLESTVDEAICILNGFEDSKPARKAVAGLQLLQDVGLGYVALGQPINTLSGGESQRLKLVRHLADSSAALPATHPNSRKDGRRDNRGTLFLLDEPTTGLHFDDIRILLNALQRLVDAGHSLVVVEHNLDVLKCADWIIDLGPEAGDAGGQLVVAGPPEAVAASKLSHTGRYLRQTLSAPGTQPGGRTRTGGSRR